VSGTVPPDELLEKRRRFLSSALSLSHDPPLHIVRGEGAYLYDAEGRRYLDCVNNVAHVGHCHPRVVEAACRQMGQLNTNTRYLHPEILEYAERLTHTLPEPLRVCFFVNSGSEANELALRLARAHTGRREVIAVDGAYHGNTSSLVEISPYKFSGPGGGGKPEHVEVVSTPDPYRGHSTGSEQDLGERYAAELGAAVRRMATEGRPPGAFFVEPLLSTPGYIVPPPGYLDLAFRTIRESGGVCVADEVQTGFGRVGAAFWGFETQEAIPDIVTMGKPMGNGHPIGAVVTTPEVARSFEAGMEWFSTFGGNPVSCTVGMAVLDVIEEEGLQRNALDVGSYLETSLTKLVADHEAVGDVRGMGLFMGVELVVDRETKEPASELARRVVARARDRGVLLGTDGPRDNVLKIKPPMVFSRGDADRLTGVLDEVLTEP
jgi:4-aminobutyrate aminotransferase-like enzyme